MKKLIALTLIGMLTVGVLSGCEGMVTQDSKTVEVHSERFISTGGTESINVMTDTETGCKYITYDRGISPFYDSDGKVQGCKNNK
jgi:hypothetical protein